MQSDFKIMPDIGTPEEAKTKLKEAYSSFLDSCAKFVTLAAFYSDPNNENQPVAATFQDDYSKNYAALKNDSVDDFGFAIANYTLLYLEFVDEIKDNLNQYNEIMKGQDPALSDYDKACDLLAIKDEFTDLEKVINDVNQQVAEERIADTHYNDPKYDLQALQSEKMAEDNSTKQN
jgi:hypothetical protein